MKASEFREMSQDEIQTKMGDLQRHLFDLKSQAVTEKLENTQAVRNTRRDIARAKSVLRENELNK